jgi:2-methylaconitate cis-trans-isomerase PrpF
LAQRAIPFLFFRGGTSRGPYFRASDLPTDRDLLANVLIAAIGSGQRHNIDGIGGGVATTTKVAILSKSSDPRADIDYFFAQVSVEGRSVDFQPTCGNILSGVGPAAIEMGLFPAQPGQTLLRVRAVNTGALVDVVVETTDSAVSYEGDVAIDGVPGTSAPIRLGFRDIVGSVTGKLLPTGNAQDCFEGIAVTCIDVAIPMVIARAKDFGLSGNEPPSELDGNAEFSARRERIRQLAGLAMGMGDVSGSVIPKFAIVSAAQHGGVAGARHFMPATCHPTMAVTGAQCIAAALLLPGGVASHLVPTTITAPANIRLEHPSGHIDVLMDFSIEQGALVIHTAGLMRTARLLARGDVMVPGSVWR